MNRQLISIIGLLGFCAANADNLGYSPDGGLVSFGDFDYVYDTVNRRIPDYYSVWPTW